MFLDAYKKALGVLMKKPFMLWGLSLLGTLIVAIAFVVCGVIPALAIAVGYLVMAGMAKIYLDGLKGKDVNSEQLFAGFNKNCLRIVGALAWRDLWIIIWALIPIVGPVIALIKSYSYRFVPYIVMTNPDIKATEALKKSIEMTEGKKMQMFLADLCVFGAIFVVFFVLGLLSAIPYIGYLFMFVMFIVYVAVVALIGIFVGLYQASFYPDDEAEAPAAEPEFN